MAKQFDEAPQFAIAPIVEHYAGDVTYRGGWSPMCCFIHQERTPSATINHSAQRFMCFRCLERSEDAIGLVMHIESVGFREAVEICEQICGPAEGKGAGSRGGMSSMF